MPLTLRAGESSVDLDEAFFTALPLEHLPAFSELWTRFYGDPVVTPEALATDVHEALRRLRPVLREQAAERHQVRARGDVRERILDQLTADHDVLKTLHALLALAARAEGAGEPIRGLSD